MSQIVLKYVIIARVYPSSLANMPSVETTQTRKFIIFVPQKVGATCLDPDQSGTFKDVRLSLTSFKKSAF